MFETLLGMVYMLKCVEHTLIQGILTFKALCIHDLATFVKIYFADVFTCFRNFAFKPPDLVATWQVTPCVSISAPVLLAFFKHKQLWDLAGTSHRLVHSVDSTFEE